MEGVSYPIFDMLAKNLSYEGNYRKIFYARLVYDRICGRKASLGCRGLERALSNSFDNEYNLSSSDSLPDLLIASSNGDDTDEEICEASKFCWGLRRCSSSENVGLESLDSFSRLEAVGIKPYLADSDSMPSLPRSSASGSGEDVNVTGEETVDIADLLDAVVGKPRRRRSSLRSQEAPSSADMVRKKSVRFADFIGRDLQSVRHILNKDDPPVLPRAALRDLVKGIEEANRTEGMRYICASFTQPGLASDFLERVETRKIALERCLVDDHDRTVTGLIRVANLCFNKVVIVRYSLNSWVTFNDIAASYVLNSNDGKTDKFAFTINLPMSMTVGSRLEFALKFAALDLGSSFWDNNFGDNYHIVCYAKAIPTHKSDSTWMHFL